MDITAYGNVPALWYQSDECGMPLHCLAAMERYFNGLKDGDDLYEYSVCMHLQCNDEQHQADAAETSSTGANWGTLFGDGFGE